jgi:UDP-N-acetylmuramoyl-L-alanyl-D-glutamate--2,6-diaminopimelate ligase
MRPILARLRELDLLREVPAGVEDVEIGGITDDSRLVEPGWLFCAVHGGSFDGHDFLEPAAQAGAGAALVERPGRALDLPQVEVTDGRAAATAAAALFFGNPWRSMRAVAVTGTNGKTTTVAMLHHLLGALCPTGSIGTLGALDPAGRTLEGSEGLTTPGAVDVARWIAALRDRGAGAVAMEASSHALHQGRLGEARFDVAIFTTFSRDHLDYHPTMEEYRAAKLRLLDHLKGDGVVVLNADDAAWEGITSTRTVTYGLDREADVYASDLQESPTGVTFRLHLPDGSYAGRLPLIGRYNVSNALAAAASLHVLGLPGGAIAERLATLPQTPGRLERVAAPEDRATVLIDFAHTPDALRGCLAALRPVTCGRLIVVFGAGGDRDPGKRPEMGAAAAECSDHAIVTSDNPRSEDPGAIADQIEAGMGDAPRERILDRRAAIAAALEMSGPGDVVLLAGKGHERYQEAGGVKRPFDEREVVAEVLASLTEVR